MVVTPTPSTQPIVVPVSATETQTSDASPLKPQATYYGKYANEDSPVGLRLGNGGAGQSGLIGAFADAFIDWRVEKKGDKPFKVEWYLGDTTQSLSYLSSEYIDIAFTYNEAAELAEVKSGKAVRRDLIFMDHFYLVGPKSNPADLDASKDSATDMFNKIVQRGNADVVTPPDLDKAPATRFLSRYDKSATNIKESEIFIKIGQVPWALAYSVWYHQYPRFPLQALSAAAYLSEYTLTDRGIWLSSPSDVTEKLQIFAEGASSDGNGETATDKDLLNPCNALLSSKPLDASLATECMDWLVDVEGGQEVVKNFKKNGEMLYTPAVSA